MNTIELTPGSISVEDFGKRVRSIHSGMGYEPVLNGAIQQIDGAYHQIDPLHTLTLPHREASMLVSSLGRAAQACESALKGRSRSMNRKKRDSTLSLLGDLLIDRATVAMTIAGQDMSEFSGDVERAQEVYQETSALRKVSKKTYQHHNIRNLYGGFSALTTGIYIDALSADKLSPSERPGQTALLRARLGGVAISAIKHMRVMSDALHHGKGKEQGNERGRFMEMTAFTQKVLLWHDNNLSDTFVRFALEREDRPRTSSLQSRGFDLMTRQEGKIIPVQVKVGHGSEGYHESISMWRPRSPEEMMEATSLVVGTFETVVDSRANRSDVKRARSLIASQFLETRRQR